MKEKITIENHFNLKDIEIVFTLPYEDYYNVAIGGLACIIGENGVGKSNLIDYFINEEPSSLFHAIYYSPIINNRPYSTEKIINISDNHYARTFEGNYNNLQDFFKLWYLLHSRTDLKTLKLSYHLVPNMENLRINEAITLIEEFTCVTIDTIVDSVTNFDRVSLSILIWEYGFINKELYLKYRLSKDQPNEKLSISDFLGKVTGVSKTDELSEFRDFISGALKFTSTDAKVEIDVILLTLERIFHSRYFTYFKINFYFNVTSEYSFSTGDESYFSFLGSLLVNLKKINIHSDKPYLLLLDEIDIAFHPSRQVKLIHELVKNIEVLVKQIGLKNKIYILLTTHSPFISCDVPAQNIVYLTKGGDSTIQKNVKKSFAYNINDHLRDNFGLKNGLLGQVSLDSINYLIDQSKSKSKTAKHKKSIKEKINQLEDPFLKSRFEEMFNEIVKEK